MKPLRIIKLGGQLLEDTNTISKIIAQLASLDEACIVIHGGGKRASQLAQQLHIQQQIIDGRRITDAPTLEVAIMVYAGLINKKMVAQLQGQHVNALGLSGADLNCIQSIKRPIEPIDYGWVGDTNPALVNGPALKQLLKIHIMPIICSLTWDGQGQLLNTNADAIAAAVAIALSDHFTVQLSYCFEKNGVLLNPTDNLSYLKSITKEDWKQLEKDGIINEGMLPKLTYAFQAAEAGVAVTLGNYELISQPHKGTLIQIAK